MTAFFLDVLISVIVNKILARLLNMKDINQKLKEGMQGKKIKLANENEEIKVITSIDAEESIKEPAQKLKILEDFVETTIENSSDTWSFRQLTI